MEIVPDRDKLDRTYAPPMPDGASGTVALLFTDIERSTELLAAHPAAMRAAQRWHDACVREVMARHGGHLFKSLGDGVCVAFSTASPAIAAALELQRSMAHQPESEVYLRVRVAIQAGSVEREGDDYRGLALHRASRLLSAAHGGQALVSESARSLAEGVLPEGASLVHLGSHRLRDFEGAESIYQLRHADLAPLDHPGFATGFPPLRTVDSVPNNLPRQLSTFIGREQEMVTVTGLVAAHSLVTLTGSGGSGKTRLALQAAADLLPSFPDGVTLVELAPLSTSALVEQTVAQSLGAELIPSQPAIQAAIARIGAKTVLLVLDNCEHVWRSAAATAQSLLQACPNLRILATGRRRLGLRGERAWLVPTLSVPSGDAVSDLESMARCEAVQLFTQRAAEVRAGFQVTAQNAAAVADICRRLDGIPLALELAAVRIRTLTPEQIAQRLHRRFSLLAVDDESVPDRQKTLEAMIAWSYDLLNGEEQALFRRLAVFSGGCTLESASRVCDSLDGGEDEIDDLEVLNRLDSLIEHSLLISEEGACGQQRYRMLETIREFAQARLEEAGESDAVADTHHRYFLELAEEAEPNLQKADQKEWLDILEADHDNFRFALKWSVESSGRLRLATALHRFWLARGFIQEGRGWIDGTLARCMDVDPGFRAKALNAAGVLAWYQGDLENAKDRYLSSLALQRDLGDAEGVANAQINLGILASDSGQFDEARSRYQEALAVFQEIGAQGRVAATLCNLGVLSYHEQDFDTATALFQQALNIVRTTGDLSRQADIIENLADLQKRMGNMAESRRLYAQSLALWEQLQNPHGLAFSLAGLASVEAESHVYSRAIQLYAAAEAARNRMRAPLTDTEQAELDRNLARAKAHLGSDRFELAWIAGSNMSLAEAIDFVNAPESL